MGEACGASPQGPTGPCAHPPVARDAEESECRGGRGSSVSVSVAELSRDVSVTLLRVKVGSPGGMGQLIKYFESQSRRLDKQTLVPQASCLNSDFESMIKFSGVPILPPAMTLSRREELQEMRRSAILMEKRHKARQRRRRIPAPENLSAKPVLTFPETSPRHAARQLNFDSDVDKREDVPERCGATNPVSTFATAETALSGDDYGLQTMDSVNSDFMSMEQSSIPKVFAGLALTSFKEQKISYDLDRLSKVLNVQDMASTSGSDVSDALGNTHTLADEDLQDAQRYAQKFLQNTPEGRSGFFHESQDTVVEVAPESRAHEDSSTSGFVDNATSSNLEQTQTSLGSSPGCGSANTTGTTDSQRSNRSSPKSLKNAVHFASFLTEYNTTSSQLFERPMIVKKKMPYEQSLEQAVPNLPHEVTTPIIGDPSESRQRHAYKNSEGDSRSNPLLNRVALNPDCDSSPLTPPFDPTSGIPFQSYGKSEPYSSDKENDASHSQPASTSSQKKSPDRPARPSPKDQTSPNVSHRWASQRKPQKAHEKSFPCAVSPDTLVRGYKSDESSKKSPPGYPETQHQSHSGQITGVSAGLGPHDLPSHTNQVGGGQRDPHLVSAPVAPSTGVITMGHTSVSDSQGSNRSATLTGGTSESSNSTGTIKDDLSARESGNLAMNIVVAGHGSVCMDTAQQKESSQGSAPADNDHEGSLATGHTNSKNVTTLSPKKLNTDPSATASPADENQAGYQEVTTPPRHFVRKGSYTLSEPSPALIKARARYQEETLKQNIPVSNGESDVHSRVSSSNTVQPTKLGQAVRDTQGVQRKLPGVTISSCKSQPEPSQGNTSGLSGSPEAEREGKAEHISKYLSQVQFQNSMNLSYQSWDGTNQSASAAKPDLEPQQGRAPTERREEDESMSQALDLLEAEDSIGGHSSVLDVLKSLVESVQGSQDSVSVQDLLSLHQQQMQREKETLIQQQQRDMEELFVQQRRDMLFLEAEIKAAQQFEKEQQEFLGENTKIVGEDKFDVESSPDQAGTWQQEPRSDGVCQAGPTQGTVPDPIHSVDNRRPQSNHVRSTAAPGKAGSEGNPQLQPKSFPGTTTSTKLIYKARKTPPFPALKRSKVSPHSPRSAWEESQTRVKTVGDESFSPREGLTSLGVPGYSQSASSPRFHGPVMLRSPLKYSPAHGVHVRVNVPPEVYSSEMKVKFEKVSAVAKGFLTRCLLQSDKVQELVKTIKDTREFAFKFQTETPVKKGVFSPQDRALLERIIAQLQAALLDIHEIFFEIPSAERMSLIEQTRTKQFDKRVKMSRDSLRGSGPRISQATLKALERKRKAREAESSVPNLARPRTAPSSSSSPRCQNHTDIRALKPLPGQGQHKSEASSGLKQDSSRPEKERPRTAPAKQLTRPKRITALSSRQMNTSSIASGEAGKDSPKEGLSKPSSTAVARVVSKTKSASVKPVSNRPGKSWR